LVLKKRSNTAKTPRLFLTATARLMYQNEKNGYLRSATLPHMHPGEALQYKISTKKGEKL
jgi:hypothetical protein